MANSYISSLSDDAAKATVAAGAVTLFGVIFSALYNEVSAYYKERSQNICRKWDLIYPLIKNDYNPWIYSASSLLDALEDFNPTAKNDDVIIHILYLTSVFYGNRLRFITKDGGLVLLSTPAEEKKVNDAYNEVKKKFQWAGTETSRKVSYLQKLFVSKDKRKEPYVQAMFAEDLKTDAYLKESKEQLKSWLTKENVDQLKDAAKSFIDCFKNSINKLYTAWGN